MLCRKYIILIFFLANTIYFGPVVRDVLYLGRKKVKMLEKEPAYYYDHF